MNASPFRLRASIGVVAVVLLLPACSGYSRHRDAEPTSSPVNYGSGAKVPTDQPTIAHGKTATIDVMVTDDRGRALPGVVVNMKGTAKGQRTTDAHGHARFTVLPGSYDVSDAPCGTTILTTAFVHQPVRVAVAGQLAYAQLPGISWKRRYTPSDTATVSRTPPWPRNTDVKLGVRVEDGCDFSAAPGASLSGYSWSASRPFKIVASSLVADHAGFADIIVRCVAAGDGSVVIRNNADASDAVDVMSASSGPPSGKHWCA